MKHLTDKNGKVREIKSTDIKGFQPARDVDPGIVNKMKTLKSQRGRPSVETPKIHIGMRLDADVVAWLRSQKGYNALVNEALREKMTD